MADTSLYSALTSTAKAFVLALSPKSPGTNSPDPERFMPLTASNYTHTWGHAFFVSTSPGVQGFISAAEFLSRMGKLAEKMQTWEIHVTDICVDVENKKAVLRTEFMMTIAGNEPVNNELVWWLKMDERGEKVVESCEFIDPVASEELMKQMKANAA